MKMATARRPMPTPRPIPRRFSMGMLLLELAAPVDVLEGAADEEDAL